MRTRTCSSVVCRSGTSCPHDTHMWAPFAPGPCFDVKQLQYNYKYRPSSWRILCNPHRSTPHNVFRLPWQNNIILVIRMSHCIQSKLLCSSWHKRVKKAQTTNISNLTGPRKCCTCVWRLQVIWFQQDCRWHQHQHHHHHQRLHYQCLHYQRLHLHHHHIIVHLREDVRADSCRQLQAEETVGCRQVENWEQNMFMVVVEVWLVVMMLTVNMMLRRQWWRRYERWQVL